MRRALAAAGLALAVAACGPTAPQGVEQEALDAAIGEAIGDPNTCVEIAGRGGEVVYRFGNYFTCSRALPDCAGGRRTLADLTRSAAAKPDPVTISCPSTPDGSQSVAWASGAVAGRPLVYAAVMEGRRAPPGLVVADKLTRALEKAGLGTPPASP